jgi:metal-dependent hydrolase (beta-lactamase superfamily II)
MTRRQQLIKEVKGLNIKTIRPAHMCTTEYLESVISTSVEPVEVKVKVSFFRRLFNRK